MQLKVVKADGTIEEYFHTKVIGTICNVFAKTELADMDTAQELAEVVTYYLYQRSKTNTVTSGEILSIIQAALADTGYQDAATKLSECHYKRKLQRTRTEVAAVDIKKLSDADQLYQTQLDNRTSWNKSEIVNNLVEKHNLSKKTARTIASIVEEKLFSMKLQIIPTGLIKQLMLSETAAVLRAEKQLQTT